jgi:low temperature requirement protein LtrA
MTSARHLRPRDRGEHPTTPVELFFDLIYVFAVTQLSHYLLGDLSVAGVARTLFLLVVVWWAWVYTTWMVNWFDPTSGAVRLVLVGGALASLLMAAALPGALSDHGGLFAGAYVALQVGRNVAGAVLLERVHPLRRIFERLVAWSLGSGVLWIAGALVSPSARLAVWGAALAVDLIAPLLGYWTPGLGRSATADYAVEGGHFAERFQAFIIIALGESIVVTGATASNAGLSTSVVLALGVAFLGTGALWWLYFGEVAAHSRRDLAGAEDPGRLARDAYTYGHLPIVAGIIGVAVADDLLLAHPGHALSTAGAAMTLGGPALYLLCDGLFRLRMIGSVNPKRVLAVAALAALGLPAAHVSALGLSALVAGVLTALALWELPVGARRRRLAPDSPA